MSDPCRADGFVLRSVKHGESSLILTVFTREFGRIGLMAKGAKSQIDSAVYESAWAGG